MARMLTVALLLTIASNSSHSQDFGCEQWPPVPQVITVENVHQLCHLGADPGRIIEARWHKTEPNLILLNRPDLSATDQAVFHIAVWDVERNKGTRFRTRGRTFSQLEVAANTLIVGAKTGSLLLWDLRQEVFLYVIPVHDGAVSELLLHPSNEWLLVVIEQAKVFRYHIGSRTVTEIQLQASEDVLPLHALSFSSDGLLLAAAGDGSIGVWDTADWDAWESTGFPYESAAALWFTKDKTDLILLADRYISRWALDDRRISFVRSLKPYPRLGECTLLGGDISPDGSLLMTTDVCGRLRAWDLRKDKELYVNHFVKFRSNIVGVPTKFSPDGRYLVDRVEYDGFILLIVPEYRQIESQ